MSTSALDIAFKSFDQHIDLSDEEKRTFESLIEVVEIEKRRHVLKAGQVCKYEYFVLEGCLRSYYVDEEAIEHTTMFAAEGWWTGNLKSFMRVIPSDFYLETLENSKLLRLGKGAVEELYLKVPKFERYFRILLQNRLLSTQERISNHLSATAKERYLKFIKTHPNLIQRVPLKHIASYLGITPTYLSRLRASKN